MMFPLVEFLCSRYQCAHHRSTTFRHHTRMMVVLWAVTAVFRLMVLLMMQSLVRMSLLFSVSAFTSFIACFSLSRYYHDAIGFERACRDRQCLHYPG